MPSMISTNSKAGRKTLSPSWSDDMVLEFSSPKMPKATEVQDIRAARALIERAEEIIAAQHRRIADLENLAQTDELTGLANRRGLMAYLKRELSAAQRDDEAQGIIILCDLDGFKRINDMHGHAAGDAYLKAVAEALTKEIRPSDIVARLGGDEFAVLLTRIEPATALLRATGIERSFNSKLAYWKNESFPLRASFGFTVYNGLDNPETLLASTDLKLYAQKTMKKRNIRI